MKQKIIMFDFDNTLVDSLKYWYYIQNEKMFTNYGKKVDKTFSEKRSGFTNLETAQLFVDMTGVNRTAEEIMKEWHQQMQMCYTTKIKMLKGAMAYLMELKQQGKKLVIASATDYSLLSIALKHFGLDFFEEVFTEQEVGFGKRNPEFFKICLEKLNCNAEDIFFFEDSVSSLKSASSLGIKCCGVIHKFNKKRIKDLNLPIIKNYKNINKINLDK